MKFFYICDKGIKRSNNQDFSHAEILMTPRGKVGLFVVADGMGGHNKGEVASRLAAESFAASFHRSLEEEKYAEEYSFRRMMRRAFDAANERVYSLSKSEEMYRGMGTTMVAALSDENKLVVANVGDSRLYFLRDGAIRQITVDNSYVQELVEEGILRPEQAKTHPDRSRITRAVGTEKILKIDFYETDLQAGDKVLLCSDGLSDMLDEKEIEKLLGDHEEPKDCCEKLVEEANRKGGRDNITVICLTI